MTNKEPNEKSIFLHAIEIATDEERAEYLQSACAGNEALREELEALLRAHSKPQRILDAPDVGSPTLDQPITEKPGTQIGPYKLLQQLGEGGMGVVYMAEQAEPVERRVALKIIKPGMDTRQVIARFEAERQALAMMDHPNIARVLDAGATDSGRPYFVMELVRGVPITQYCDEKHVTPKERLELFVPVCQAVQHAHQKGIIHRDIKPSNVMVALYDDRPVPKIIDFGVAKATSHRLTDKTMFTQYGQIVGTLEYMSPEQAQLNQMDIDTRSDIYSLGVLLYELLTGETPFDRTRLRSAAFDEMLRIIREEEPSKPSTKVSSSQSLPSIAANRRMEPAKLGNMIRGELDWIVLKAIEKDRARRYETASAFAADVQHYLNDEAVVACPPSRGYKLRKFARRNKGRLVTASLLAAALLVAVGGVGWAVRDRAAQRAEVAREKSDRQTRVTTQVKLLRAEVDRLTQEQQWDEALAMVKRAEAALAVGEVPEDLQARVRQAVSDLEMVARLENIGVLTSEIKEQGFDYEGGNRHYAAAFRQYGVDVDALTIAEATTELQRREEVLPALIVGMDEWAKCRRQLQDEAGSNVLTNVAQSLDVDPWRRRLRALLASKDVEKLEELADSDDVVRQMSSSLCLLAGALESSEKLEAATKLLDRAIWEHPEDFWLRFQAAWVYSSFRPQRDDEAMFHLRVALALRPRSAAVLNNLGSILYHQKKFDEAIACWRKATELNPTFAVAHSNLGCVLMDQGKLDEAVACCRQAIELDPKDAEAHTNLGLALWKQKRLDAAVACYRTAIELDPKLVNAHSNLGNALRQQGRLDEAAASCRTAIELDPKHSGAYINLGDILFDKKEFDEAIGCYRKAIELDPELAMAHTNLGEALYNQKNFDEAISCWRKAIEIEPKYAPAHNALGNALADQGKTDQAMTCYRRAIELDPKDAVAHRNLGLCQADQGMMDEAISCFRQAIALDPQYAQAHSDLGLGLWHQGNADGAIACYRRAIELDPKDAVAHDNLGSALLDQGQLDEAIAEYRQAIDLDPTSASTHYNLGVAVKKLGKSDEAITCYRTAIELDPKHANAHTNLGIALVAQGKLEAAVACFRTAIELDPQHAVDHCGLGNVFIDQNKLDEAIAEYRIAIQLDPNITAAYNGLGTALWRQDKLDDAIAYYRQAIGLNPKDALAHKNLGNALVAQGKLDEAILCFRKVIELEPNDAGTRTILAWHLSTAEDIKLRNPREACELARKAVELQPDKANHWDNLGVAQYRVGDWQSALDALERAREMKDGKDPAHRFFLAMAHWKLGHQARAREAYMQAINWLNEKKRNEAQYRFRDEAEQLLGITPSTIPSEGGESQSQEPERKSNR